MFKLTSYQPGQACFQSLALTLTLFARLSFSSRAIHIYTVIGMLVLNACSNSKPNANANDDTFDTVEGAQMFADEKCNDFQNYILTGTTAGTIGITPGQAQAEPCDPQLSTLLSQTFSVAFGVVTGPQKPSELGITSIDTFMSYVGGRVEQDPAITAKQYVPNASQYVATVSLYQIISTWINKEEGEGEGEGGEDDPQPVCTYTGHASATLTWSCLPHGVDYPHAQIGRGGTEFIFRSAEWSSSCKDGKAQGQAQDLACAKAESDCETVAAGMNETCINSGFAGGGIGRCSKCVPVL